MSSEDPDLIARAESTCEKILGEPISIDEIADNFALYGLTKRAAALENLDSELRDDIDSSPHSLRRRLRVMELRRKMNGLHHALRKAKR